MSNAVSGQFRQMVQSAGQDNAHLEVVIISREMGPVINDFLVHDGSKFAGIPKGA